MKVFSHIYNKVISLENLFQAWNEFKRGKRRKSDVGYFERHLEDNIFKLRNELINKTYHHSVYTGFYIKDPKIRHIHKAMVRDRIVHHALFKVLTPIFEATFIADSYSSRVDYGTHKGFEKLVTYARKVSKNYTRDCWALKCDIKKFFHSLDHQILLSIIKTKIDDPEMVWLLKELVESYETAPGKGVPIGNLTSQLFANIYLNKLDQFIKHQLKVKYYLRYADDFIILNENKNNCYYYIRILINFLGNNLKLRLHPNKILIRKLSWGIDFVGYVVLPHHQVLRTKTKRRILKKIKEKINQYRSGQINLESLGQSTQSYFGILKHANTYKLKQDLSNNIFFWLND